MEQLQHFVQLLVHACNSVVKEGLKLLRLLLSCLHRRGDFVVQLLNDERKLLNLELLPLDLAILVLDEAVGDVQIRLQLLKLVQADHVLGKLRNPERQLLVLNRLTLELPIQLFDLLLHLLDLRLLRLSLRFELGLGLLERVDLHKVLGHLLLEEFDHLSVDAFLVAQLPLQVIDSASQ